MQYYLNEYVIPALGALVFLAVAWVVAGWVRRLIRRSLERTKFDLTLTRFFSNLAYYAILIFGVLSCLTLFGFSVASFAAVLAAVGFAVGLALQGSLSNFAAGVMLLIFRPFNVNDMIDVAGARGRVHEIQLFTTTLDTPDNRRLTVPNGNIFSDTIENETFHDTRRVDVAVGTDYPADLNQTRTVLLQAATGVAGRLQDKEPVAYLDSLGDSSINWSVRVWANTKDYWAVRDRLTQAVKDHLDEAGIGIPYPQMDVHLDRLD
jgi:small conductance mechanosensitive channel